MELDLSFIFAREETKLSKSLAAFRQLLERLDEEKRDQLIEQVKRLKEASNDLGNVESRLSITIHCVEQALDEAPMDYAVPPAILLMAIEKWSSGEPFVPDGISLMFDDDLRLSPSYGARDGR